MSSRLARLARLALLASVAACIARPVEQAKMCETSDDCRDGTSCIDDFCYGDPPRTIRLAGVLSTPASTNVTDIPMLEISEDGEIMNVGFAPSVRVAGRITFDTLPLDGFIEFRRPSTIAGLGDITVRVEVKPDRDPAFEVRLLPGVTYEVKIEPGDTPLNPDGGPAASEVAPARYFSYLVGEADAVVEWSLEPEGGLRAITGVVQDSVGEPIVGARVKALGGVRGFRDRPSTVAMTGTDGTFTVFASREYDPEFDIEVKLEPSATSVLRLTRRAVTVVDYPGTPVPYDIGTIRMPAHAAVDTFQFQLAGQASYGGAEPVGGADVLARTQLESPDEVVYEATATSDNDGNAVLQLIPEHDYLVDVVPPPEAPHGSLFGTSVRAGQYGVPPPLSLPRRVSVSGSIVTIDQMPVAGLKVQARLTFAYLMSLPAEERAKVEGLVWKATEVEDGFVLYVDGTLFADEPTPPAFDLEVTPPEGTWLPTWSFDNYVDFTRDVPVMGAFANTTRQLPQASLVRAFVTDEHGVAAPGAHLEVYALADAAICAALGVDGDCRPKPRRLALGVSEDDGWIRGLVLPNPDAP